MNNLSPITNFLITLSQEACAIMLKYYSPLGVHGEMKSDMSPVTKADIEINEMVIKKVKENYSEYEILAEEISTDTSKSNKLFVVDPLDGTRMFMIGAPLFGFMAAVVEEGKSIAGVLASPLSKRTLVAELGKGAYLAETGDRIHVSEKSDFDRALINTGWKNDKIARLFHQKGARTPEVYGACEASSLVVVGGFNAALFDGPYPHDFAAVKIVVEEAGGKVTDLFGHDQRYDQAVRGAIVSNGKLHDDLVKMAQESGLINDLPVVNGMPQYL